MNTFSKISIQYRKRGANMTSIVKLKLKLKLNNISFIDSSNVVGSLIRIYLEEGELCLSYEFVSKIFKNIHIFVQSFVENLKYENRNLKLHNFIPIEIRLQGDKANITPIIPSSTLRGLLRCSYDICKATELLKCINYRELSHRILTEVLIPRRENIKDIIYEIDKFIIRPLIEDKGDKGLYALKDILIEDRVENLYGYSEREHLCLILLSFILALQSANSCLSVFDSISCSIPLSKKLIMLRNLLKNKFSIHNYTICKSCLVFGCKGLKSPLIIENARPSMNDDEEIRLVIRTFNQICQPGRDKKGEGIAKTAPYTLIGFDKELEFETKVVLRLNKEYHFANMLSLKEHNMNYEDLLLCVLQDSINFLSGRTNTCIIRLGKRGCLGYGKISIILCEKVI